MDFTIRIYRSKSPSTLEDIQELTISNITLLCKDNKFDPVRIVKANQKKFGYDINIKTELLKIGGSHSSPCITFKGDCLEIEVKNFPRYPAFGQCKYQARNLLNGYKDHLVNNGYPIWEKFRKIEIEIN